MTRRWAGLECSTCMCPFLWMVKLNQITGNTNTQIFMRATDKFTMDYVEQGSPDVDVYKALFVNHELGLSSSKERMVKGADLNKLNAGCFFAKINGIYYQLYTPFEKWPEGLQFVPAEVFCIT